MSEEKKIVVEAYVNRYGMKSELQDLGEGCNAYITLCPSSEKAKKLDYWAGHGEIYPGRDEQIRVRVTIEVLETIKERR
jgi:hypothetical protein